VQVKPSKPLRRAQPPKELQQHFLVAQRARQQQPETFLELHLEILSSTQSIHTRTQQLRAATRRLCGK